MTHPYKDKCRQNGGSVDADGLRKRGEFKLWLRAGELNKYLPSNYKLMGQQQKDKEETMDISRKVRRNLPYSDE